MTWLAWLIVSALGAWLLPLDSWPLAAVVTLVAVVLLAAALCKPLFTSGTQLGEREEYSSALLLTTLSGCAAWLLPPVGRFVRWRIAILANLSWLTYNLRWERLRVWTGAAEIRRARSLAARHPDRRYLLANALTMEACRFGGVGRIDLALPLAQEALQLYDDIGDPDFHEAARHAAKHLSDWERGIVSTH